MLIIKSHTGKICILIFAIFSLLSCGEVSLQKKNDSTTKDKDSTEQAERNKEHNTQIDITYYYRLSNTFLGEGKSLDTYSESFEPFMGKTGNYSGQKWKLIPLGDNYFRLTNSFLGEEKSLDTYSDSHKLFMGKTGDYSGQKWKLIPLDNGFYRLTNSFLGNRKSLDTYSDSHEPFMGETGNYSGQKWKLIKIESID
jgi:hypothetical protein